MSEWIDIASLTHSKNLQGGFVAQSASDLPFLLSEGMELALVPPVYDAPRRVHVLSIEPRNEISALVFFEEVDNADVACKLTGCHCLARRSDIDFDVLPDCEVEPRQGWRVYDVSRGFIGVIDRIEKHPYQWLVVVAGEDGTSKLIPYVDEFISSVNEADELIEFDCPSGLLDL